MSYMLVTKVMHFALIALTLYFMTFPWNKMVQRWAKRLSIEPINQIVKKLSDGKSDKSEIALMVIVLWVVMAFAGFFGGFAVAITWGLSLPILIIYLLLRKFL